MTDSLRIGSVTADQIQAGSINTGALVRLSLPYDRPPESLWGNSRSHWRRRSKDTLILRSTVQLVARSAGLHRWCDGQVEHVTASLTWAPGDRRRRDVDNLWPFFKVICDGLARGPRKDWVGLELVPDDTPEWFTKNAPVIAPPPAEKGMWLALTIRFKDAA